MMEDKKVKSLRIDDETADKFKEISAAIGGNQQETMSKLIEAYEFQKGKVILLSRKSDIEKFENYVTILTRLYMGSLEESQNLEDNVRVEFDAQLKSKDQIIQELQEKNGVLNETKKAAINESEALKNENTELLQRLSTVKRELEEKALTYDKMLSDKEELNRALTNANREQQLKIENMEIEVKQAKEVKSKYSELEQQVVGLKHLKEELEKRLVDEKASFDKDREIVEKENLKKIDDIQQQAKFESDKALFELEKRYESELQALKESRQEEIDKYQEMNLKLLERLSSPHGEEETNN